MECPFVDEAVDAGDGFAWRFDDFELDFAIVGLVSSSILLVPVGLAGLISSSFDSTSGGLDSAGWPSSVTFAVASASSRCSREAAVAAAAKRSESTVVVEIVGSESGSSTASCSDGVVVASVVDGAALAFLSLDLSFSFSFVLLICFAPSFGDPSGCEMCFD